MSRWGRMEGTEDIIIPAPSDLQNMAKVYKKGKAWVKDKQAPHIVMWSLPNKAGVIAQMDDGRWFWPVGYAPEGNPKEFKRTDIHFIPKDFPKQEAIFPVRCILVD